jgi:GT2 family glycosyltransferase
MSQENTLRAGPWSYAQTANALVRRAAFTRVGGFVEGIRSAGDADLCFRLRVAGWELEPRLEAAVVHHNRAGARAFLRQKLRHGSGVGWLDARYPGSFPARDRVSYAKWFLRELAAAAGTTARGKPGAAADRFFEVLVIGASELGRLFPNRARGA